MEGFKVHTNNSYWCERWKKDEQRRIVSYWCEHWEVDEQGRVVLDHTSLYPEVPYMEREEEEKKEVAKLVFCPSEEDAKKDVFISGDSEDNPPSCVICLSNTPVCVISPCNHKSVCSTCARTMTAQGTKKRGEVQCPLCKVEVKKIFRIFE